MPNGTNDDDSLSRRKMLALTLSGAAAGIAGCNQDAGEGTTPPGTDTATSGGTTNGTTDQGTTETTTEQETTLSADQMADSVADIPIDYPPQDANWNPYSSGPNEAQLTWDHTAFSFWNNETAYWLLEDDGYSYDSESQTATYAFREDYSSWWNGDPVTGEDFWMFNEIERLQIPESSDIESWELQDDYTVTATRKQQINPVLLGSGTGTVYTYREKFRQWLEQLQEASSQDERNAATQELTNWQISSQEFMDEGLGNTTYQLADINTTEYVWEKFEDHPLADEITVPTIRSRVGDGSAINQMISNDEIDFESGKFPSNLREVSPDYLQTLFERKTIQCRNLLFNYNNKHLARRNVRRALVTILDFTHLKNFWQGEGGFTKDYQTGIPEALENKWLGSDFMNQIYEYPVGADEEQANQFMEDAGYSKQNGTWVGPDGDALNFRFMIGSFLTMVSLGKAMNQTWKQWGANSELINNQQSQWIEDTTAAEGWDITIWLHGFNALNPLNYYNYSSHWFMRLGTKKQVQQWLDEGRTHSPINGRPITPTIPSQPGLEVGDSGRQINIYELVEELKVTQSEDRTREITRTLATYFNYDLPMFDMFPQTSAMWGDTQDFNWPEEDPNTWYTTSFNAKYLTVRKGNVEPVPQDQ